MKGVRISPDFSTHRKYLSLISKKSWFGDHGNEETKIFFPQRITTNLIIRNIKLCI